MTTLRAALERTLYEGYAYAYPHKTAYRPLDPKPDLAEVWRDEDLSSLYLYAHVPFCEMRCGFCNLFTSANPGRDLVGRYLDGLERQVRRVRRALAATPQVARLGVGGGTPTFLSAGGLTRLFDILEREFGFDVRSVAASVETSPGTATDDRLQVLRERGVHRLSMGVQSFEADVLRVLGRPQQDLGIQSALHRIRRYEFPVVNLDLIYGAAGQTERKWEETVRRVIAYGPEEIFLYPLYVRRLTGLDGRTHANQRARLYALGRDLLCRAGYRQLTMRAFRRADVPDASAPAYSCQRDGMIGVGAGARSYTRRLHYSFDYAVSRGAVKEILADFCERSEEDFGRAEVGVWLDAEEQRRRFVIQSLLSSEGLPLSEYETYFGTSALADLPQLEELPQEGLAAWDAGRLKLNQIGYAASDAVGPWLFSDAMRHRSGEFALR